MVVLSGNLEELVEFASSSKSIENRKVEVGQILTDLYTNFPDGFMGLESTRFFRNSYGGDAWLGSHPNSWNLIKSFDQLGYLRKERAPGKSGKFKYWVKNESIECYKK